MIVTVRQDETKGAATTRPPLLLTITPSPVPGRESWYSHFIEHTDLSISFIVIWRMTVHMPYWVISYLVVWLLCTNHLKHSQLPFALVSSLCRFITGFCHHSPQFTNVSCVLNSSKGSPSGLYNVDIGSSPKYVTQMSKARFVFALLIVRTWS
jgi:hypothetical protein